MEYLPLRFVSTDAAGHVTLVCEYIDNDGDTCNTEWKIFRAAFNGIGRNVDNALQHVFLRHGVARVGTERAKEGE